MKLERSITVQQELITRLNDLYSLARQCHLTSTEINARYGQLFDRYAKDLPHHVKSYVRGYRQSLDDQLYRHHLTFGYRWAGRIFPAKWDTYPEELKEACRAGTALEHGHYWTETLATPGQEKHYFRGGA